MGFLVSPIIEFDTTEVLNDDLLMSRRCLILAVV